MKWEKTSPAQWYQHVLWEAPPSGYRQTWLGNPHRRGFQWFSWVNQVQMEDLPPRISRGSFMHQGLQIGELFQPSGVQATSTWPQAEREVRGGRSQGLRPIVQDVDLRWKEDMSCINSRFSTSPTCLSLRACYGMLGMKYRQDQVGWWSSCGEEENHHRNGECLRDNCRTPPWLSPGKRHLIVI